MSGSDSAMTPRRAASMTDDEMREKGVELNDRLDRLLNRKTSLSSRTPRGSVDISARAKEVEESLTSALERLRQEKLKGIQDKINASIGAEISSRTQIEQDEARARAHIVDTLTSLEEAEAKRRIAEEEAAEVLRLAQEEAEAERQALEEAEAERRAEEEAKRRAEEEAEAKRRAEEAEARRRAEEAEAKRRAEEEAEAKRRAEEAEARRRAEEAEAKRRAEEEAEAKRRASLASGGGDQPASRSLNVAAAAKVSQRGVVNAENSSSNDDSDFGGQSQSKRHRRRRRPIDFTAPFVDKERERHPALPRTISHQRPIQRGGEVSSNGSFSTATLAFMAALGAFIVIGVWAARS